MPPPTLHHAQTIVLVLLPLIVWRVLVRARRAVGRQALSPTRLKVNLGIYLAIVTALAVLMRAQTPALLTLWGSLLGGAMLAGVGLKLTVFEKTPGRLFFTPNTWLGGSLFLIFAARMLYVLVRTWSNSAPGALAGTGSGQQITLAVFGLLAGYNLAFHAGLLWWRHQVLARRRRA